MNPNKTNITVVLDRSGSMCDIKEDMEGGFNAFLAEQAKQPGDCYLTLVQFDHEYQVVYDNMNLKDVLAEPPLKIFPRGSTALRDAIGRAITTTGESLAALPEADRPGHVIVLIITDGRENASREYSHEKIKEMIKHQTEVYKWQFIYLGADEKAVEIGVGLGVKHDHSAKYGMNSANVKDVLQKTSGKIGSVRHSGISGQSVSAYTPQEREEIDTK